MSKLNNSDLAYRLARAGIAAHNWISTAAALEKDSAVYPVTIPDCEKGDWKVRNFELRDMEFGLANLRSLRDGVPEAVVSSGKYVRLQNSNGVVMSNTQLEYRTNKPFIDAAHGNVLVAGLGLGMVLNPLASKLEVEHITVVEVDPDVIALVLPHYEHIKNLTVICDDIMDFEPKESNVKFDVAMFDIWPCMAVENLLDMQVLEDLFENIPQKFFWSKEILLRRGLR